MSKTKTKNPLLQTLLSMIDTDNTITVNRPIVMFLGSLEGAMLLSQLLYWTPRTTLKGKMKGWVAKSDKDFQDELCLSRYSVRSARELLHRRKLIKTHVAKFYGTPTIHYFVRWDELEKQWIDFLPRLSEIEQSIVRNRTIYGLSEIEQSLTETTRDYPTKRERFKSWKDTPHEYHPYFETCINKPISLPTPTTPKEIRAWLETFTEWINKGFTPEQVTSAARLARKRDAAIARPASLNWALSDQHSRKNGQEEKPPAQGESVLAKLAQKQKRI